VMVLGVLALRRKIIIILGKAAFFSFCSLDLIRFFIF
jgi:hypothetical protein